MNQVENMRRILAEEYGITSDAELEAALRNTKLDIFSMAGKRKARAVPNEERKAS